MRLTRRKLLGGVALAAGAGMVPGVALAAGQAAGKAEGMLAPGIIIDPTIPAAGLVRSYARTAAQLVAEQGHDLAALFYASGPGWLADGRALAGVTGWSGRVVAQGIARERGLSFTPGLPPAMAALAGAVARQPGAAFCWTIG